MPQRYAAMDQRVAALDARTGVNSRGIGALQQASAEQKALHRAEAAEKPAVGTLLSETVFS